MRPLIQEISTAHTPETLVENLRSENGVVLLRTSAFDSPSARYSFVAANPFLIFKSSGSRCEIACPQTPDAKTQTQFGNPWRILDALMARCELLEEIDSPFPLGGAFGFWGYDLKNFTEPKLPRRAMNDLELPDCHVGFYDSLVVFDHQLGKVSVISTGLNADGSRSEAKAQERLAFWKNELARQDAKTQGDFNLCAFAPWREVSSNLTRGEFISKVQRAQRYIRAGDIYQVNLSQRLTAQVGSSRRDDRTAQRAVPTITSP
jgi:para-aminobenzoate synthetase component 1